MCGPIWKYLDKNIVGKQFLLSTSPTKESPLSQLGYNLSSYLVAWSSITSGVTSLSLITLKTGIRSLMPQKCYECSTVRILQNQSLVHS